MCSRSSSQTSLKQTSISYRLDVWKGTARQKTHGRLPRHISLDELTSALWCKDLWPISGSAKVKPKPHSSIVWSYLISSFQQLSCFSLQCPLSCLWSNICLSQHPFPWSRCGNQTSFVWFYNPNSEKAVKKVWNVNKTVWSFANPFFAMYSIENNKKTLNLMF